MQKEQLPANSNSLTELKSINELMEFEKSITLNDCLVAVPLIGMPAAYRPIIKSNIDYSLTMVATAHSIKLTEDQVTILTNDLFERYKSDSYQDIILCLKELRQGVYGKLFGRLDIGVISDAMADHLDKKYQLKEAQLSSFKSGDMSPKILEPRTLKQISDKLDQLRK